jgi:cation:H+ antiporter
MNITVILIGILGITLGGGWLVDGISRLARAFGISQLVAGLTVVTIVTAGPELLISVNAASRDAAGLVLGTVAGANIANIGLVLGLGGLVAGGLPIATGVVRRAAPVLLVVAAAVYGLLWLGEMSQVMGFGLIAAFIVFYVGMLVVLRHDATVAQIATAEMQQAVPLQTDDRLLLDDPHLLNGGVRVNRLWAFVQFVAGIIVLLTGVNYIVEGALEMVTQLDANEVAVGATLVALATSLPELVAVMMAVSRRQPDVALGNIIGSSVANLMLVIGVAAVVQPLWIARRALMFEFPVMLGLMLLLVLVVIDRKLSVWESLLYVVAYAAFLYGVWVI